MSWLEYSLLTEQEVRAAPISSLPSSNKISQAVFVNLADEYGALVQVAGFVVASAFTASKVSYSVAFPAAVQPRNGMRLYSVVSGIPSELVSPNDAFSWSDAEGSGAVLDAVGSDTFALIEQAAHAGAFGNNDYPEPTEEQKKSGDYLKGKITLYGLPLLIEQPRGCIRTGVNEKTGVQWSNRMAAHYGEVAGTTGADNDPLDVFIGTHPEAQTVYVINQIDPDAGGFDEHKLMLCFADEEQARSAYLMSFDLNWKGMGGIVPASIDQIKWWIKNGDTSAPLTPSALPAKGYENMNKVQWSGEEPVGVTLDAVLYDIRRHDEDGLMLDSLTVQDILDDSDGVDALDALVTPFSRLQRNMEKMQALMMRVTEAVRPVAMQITDPFKQRGVANVAVVFELSDGQTLSVFFHNPDATPNKMLPSDELISWKWMLNKKDITIVAAPEYGNELSVREVARRVMRIAAKNSAAFVRQNTKRAERLQSIDALKSTVAEKEAQLKKVLHAIEVRKVDLEPPLSKAKPVAPVVVAAEPLAQVVIEAEPAPESEIIASFENRSENMESFVTKTVFGLSVSLMDSDSGEVLPTIFKFTHDQQDQAIDKAKELVNIKDPAPAVKAAPLVDPVAPVAEMTAAPSLVVAPEMPIVEVPPVAAGEPLADPIETAVDVGAVNPELTINETLPQKQPEAGKMTPLEWEDAVYRSLEEIGEMTRSDAQDIVAGQQPLLAAQYAAGAAPAVAAEAVLTAAESGSSSLPVAPTLSVAVDADVAMNIAFLQSVIDGTADIWDSELPTRLENSLASMQGDQDRMKLWNDAVNAYSKQMMSAATQKLA